MAAQLADTDAGQNSWRLAAPSFVLPGTVAENCAFLQGRVDEVALCLFESEACLAYDEKDLPAWLADLPGRTERMAYHVHLPLDLPWHKGQDEVFAICDALAWKTAFLSPRAFVLHPPEETGLLQAFLERWNKESRAPRSICLENTRDNDLAQCLKLAYAEKCGICLDFGHALTFSQHWMLESPELADQVRMLHLYAPGGEKQGRHKHLPLTALQTEEQAQLRTLFELLGPGKGRSLVLEVFDWHGWQHSAAALEHILCPALAAASGRKP